MTQRCYFPVTKRIRFADFRFQISDFRFQIVSRRLRGWTQIMARGRRAMPYAECHKAVGLERFLSLSPFPLFAFSLLPFPFCLFQAYLFSIVRRSFTAHSYGSYNSQLWVIRPTIMGCTTHNCGQ